LQDCLHLQLLVLQMFDYQVMLHLLLLLLLVLGLTGCMQLLGTCQCAALAA
jgi:hypothetical protein